MTDPVTGPVTDPNLNALWCRAVAEELWRAGCRSVVLCPGSRNSPLLFALAKIFGANAVTWIDERAAAFMALGMAKASGAPAAVCVTSGTAVANCAPAVSEANASHVPLYVLAADRPWEYQQRGAPQTMDQRGILGSHAVEVVLGEPGATDVLMTALRARVSRGALRDRPVVFHLPLRDPLPPLPDANFSTEGLSQLSLHGRGELPFVQRGHLYGQPPNGHWGTLDWLKPGLKGLWVIGALTTCDDAMLDCITQSGYPVIADITASLHGHLLDQQVVLADALLSTANDELTPDVIIRVGPTPLNRGSWEWLSKQTCSILAIESGRDLDWLGNVWASVDRPDAATWAGLTDVIAEGELAWLDLWLTADRAAQKSLHQHIPSMAWCDSLAAHIAVNHEGFSSLHLSASLSMRYANWHCVPRPHAPVSVFANRGVNGIDGVVATFAGAMRGDTNGLLLIGDIALQHDLGSLSLAARELKHCAIVVLNNDGGGIFDQLPVRTVPGYETLIRTPHGQSFGDAAAHAGLAYALVADRDALKEALEAAAQHNGCTLIECACQVSENATRHRTFTQTFNS